ncbi:MAG: hypothetical protein RLZZ579_1186, partial [Actinomycetota bacterium]
SFVLPIAGVVLGVISALQTDSEIATPSWQLLTAIAVIGVFDAFAGFASVIAFAVLTAVLNGVSGIGDFRLMIGILLVVVSPMIMARAFRSRRFTVVTGSRGAYELLVDVAVIGFIVYWLAKTIISSLPALAGTTLSVANHVGDVALILAIAAIVRVLVEELALRLDEDAFSEIEESEKAAQPNALKIAMLVIRLALFVLLASAFFGFSGWVVLACLLFVLPTTFSWFADRLPNSPLLWKLIPTKLPGLVLILTISALTLALSNQAFGSDADAAAKTFAILPVPLLALSILGLFGRHGQSVDEPRPVTLPKFMWLYRVGGIVILFVAMRLTGIL